MAAKVFISYRREDSAGHAGRVHDRLAREFGRDLLFMDVDGIPLGVNFVKVLQQEVAKCSVLLAVIGRDWLNVRGEDGQRRLDNASDFVRVEIAAALQRDIPVIPILLENAGIPRADQLPGDLQELALRNGLGVRHASFHTDMDILIRGLKERLGEADEQRGQPLARGAGSNIWINDDAAMRTAPGDRGPAANLPPAQEPSRQSDVRAPPPSVANRSVKAEQPTVAPTARRRNEVAAEPRAPSGAEPRAPSGAEPRAPFDAGPPPDDVQPIAPRADVRSQKRLFIILGLAIVVIASIGLLWPAAGPRDSATTAKSAADTASAPRDSTTTVKPVDTAIAPRESTTAVKPVANTASAPRDSTTTMNPAANSIGGLFEQLGIALPPAPANPRLDELQARADRLKAQADPIMARMETYGNTPSDLAKYQEDMRALSKIQAERSKLLNEYDDEARKAIKNIKQ
jgi:TIR domain